MTKPRLHALHVGKPKERGTEGAADPMDRPWRSGIFKEPAGGPIFLGQTNLDGDVYAVGEARVQVSQPRAPCWKLARRWKEKKLALWVQETGYTGWYLRVLETGTVEAGQPLVLEERPHPEWPIARVNDVRYQREEDPAQIAALADCAALAGGWRDRFRKWTQREENGSETPRLIGKNAADA